MSKAFKKITFLSVVVVLILSSCRGHGPLCPAYSQNNKQKHQIESKSEKTTVVEKTS